MRGRKFLFGVLLLLTGCGFLNPKQTNFLPEITQLQEHPRFLMLKNDELRIKEIINNDSTWNAVHNIIINECDEMLETTPVEYELEGRRLLEKSRTCRQRVVYLSYA